MNDEHFSFGVRLASGVDVFTQYYIRRPMVFIVGASAPLIGEPRFGLDESPAQSAERTFWIRLYPGLVEPEIDVMIETLENFCRRKSKIAV